MVMFWSKQMHFSQAGATASFPVQKASNDEMTIRQL